MLLSTRVEMMKNGEVFQHENEGTHTKCPLAQIKKLLLPTTRDSSNEIVRRDCLGTKTIKKCKSWSLPKCKEWLTFNLVKNVNDAIFLSRKENYPMTLKKKAMMNLKLQNA